MEFALSNRDNKTVFCFNHSTVLIFQASPQQIPYIWVKTKISAALNTNRIILRNLKQHNVLFVSACLQWTACALLQLADILLHTDLLWIRS